MTPEGHTLANRIRELAARLEALEARILVLENRNERDDDYAQEQSELL